MRGRFGPGLRVYRLAASLNQVLVKRIFHKGRAVPNAKQPFKVGLVFAEEYFRARFTGQLKGTKRGMLRQHSIFATERYFRFGPITLARSTPGPRIAKP